MWLDPLFMPTLTRICLTHAEAPMANNTLRWHLSVASLACCAGFVAAALPGLRWYMRGSPQPLALPCAAFFASLAGLSLGLQSWYLLTLQRGLRREREALPEAVLERRPSTLSALSRWLRLPGFLLCCESATPLLAVFAGAALALGAARLRSLREVRAGLVIGAAAAALLCMAASFMIRALHRDSLRLCAATHAAYVSLCRRDNRRSGLNWPATSAPPREVAAAVLCGGLGLVGVLGLTAWLWPGRALPLLGPSSLLRWLGVIAGLGLCCWLVCLARLWLEARSFQHSLVSMQGGLGNLRAQPNLLSTTGIKVQGHLCGLLAGIGLRVCWGAGLLASWGLLSGWSAAFQATPQTSVLLVAGLLSGAALALSRGYADELVTTLLAWQASNGVFLRWLDGTRRAPSAVPEPQPDPPWRRDLLRVDVGLLGLCVLIGLVSLLPPARRAWGEYLLTYAQPVEIRAYAEQILFEVTNKDDLLDLVESQQGQPAAVVASMDRRARQLASELSTEGWISLLEATADPRIRAALFALHTPWLRKVSLLDSHQRRVARIVCDVERSPERASLQWLAASLPVGDALLHELWLHAGGAQRTRALQALAVCGEPASISQASQGGPALLGQVARHCERGFLARAPELVEQFDRILVQAPADTANLELVTILARHLTPRIGASPDIFRILVGVLGFLERFPGTPAGRALADPSSEAAQAIERYQRNVATPMPRVRRTAFTRLLRDPNAHGAFRLRRDVLPGLLDIIVDDQAFGRADAFWWVHVCQTRFPAPTRELLWERLGRASSARRALEALASLGDLVAWHSLLAEDPAALRAAAELLADGTYSEHPGLLGLWERRLFDGGDDLDREWLLAHLCGRLLRETEAAGQIHSLIQRFLETRPGDPASQQLARAGSSAGQDLARYRAQHAPADGLD